MKINRLNRDISQKSAFHWRNAYVTGISLRTILGSVVSLDVTAKAPLYL